MHGRKAAIAAVILGLGAGMAYQGHVVRPIPQATDARLGVFVEPLIPFGAPSSQEHHDLMQAVSAYRAGHQSLHVQPLTTFLAQHPHSPYRVALWANIGLAQAQAHDIDDALTAWQRAADAVPSETLTSDQHALADRVTGRRLQVLSELGQVQPLQQLLTQVGNRPLRGDADAMRTVAHEALWQIQHEPSTALRCGWVALREVLAQMQAPANLLHHLDQQPAHTYGTSLADLAQQAKKDGYPMAMVYRQPGQPLPAPSVMHLSLGHFAAVLAIHGDQVLVSDAVLGQQNWIPLSVVNRESSGYFLTPAQHRPLALVEVTADQAHTVIGAGNTTQSMPPTPPAPPSQCPSQSGMPVCSIVNAQTDLTFHDIPVSFKNAVGEPLLFQLGYDQRNTAQPALMTFSNVGSMWTHNWLAYIQDDPNSLGNNVSIYARNGGSLAYSGYSPATGAFTNETYSQAQLVEVSIQPVVYERRLVDGGKEVYSQADGSTMWPRRIFLTQIVDPSGNTATLHYDSQNRLTDVTDATGQALKFAYQNSALPLLITQVTSPDGRSAKIGYDAQDRLQSITDALGMTTSFGYDSGTFIQSMTTPYGTSQFAYGEGPGIRRWLTQTDPMGYTEHQEFLHAAPGIPFSESQVPAGRPTFNEFINYRDSYHFDKTVMRSMGSNLDYTQADIQHWEHQYNNYSYSTPQPVPESTKRPLESRIWYYYDGQPISAMAGPSAQPNYVARVLDDGSTQATSYNYNSVGNKTSETDPAGRTTYYDYAPNGIDVIRVRHVAGALQETTAQYTYNAQHKPLTYTNASGQTSQYTYNASGKITSVTNPKGETTRYSYDSQGLLIQITNAQGHVQDSYTYDAAGRMVTHTDSEGYTLTYTYDALNRLLSTVYPDGTQSTQAWEKLDVVSKTDRLGHTTQFAYDADRNLIQKTDALGQVTRYGYDPDGRLISLTDPNGHTTSWTRDIEGRVVSKTYPNGDTLAYAYDSAGRMVRKADALGQIKQITYSVDDLPLTFSYQNAVNATPSVTYGYDALYPRMVSMQDGTGMTSFHYGPAGVTGAEQVIEEDAPDTDKITQAYNPLGQMLTRTLGISHQSWGYDSLDRVISDQSALGTFQMSYLG
ncbi:MAG: RHS repeat protein, partial [Pseudomonadales bacterium]|nr:RHS repeat protein [Pseudomonadales bacterium]